MSSYRFRWDAVWNSLDFLMAGLQMTLFLSAVTLVLAMIGGLLIAGLDMSRWRLLRWIGVSFGERSRRDLQGFLRNNQYSPEAAQTGFHG